MKIPYYINGEEIILQGNSVDELLEQIAKVEGETLYLFVGKVEEGTLCLN